MQMSETTAPECSAALPHSLLVRGIFQSALLIRLSMGTINKSVKVRDSWDKECVHY